MRLRLVDLKLKLIHAVLLDNFHKCINGKGIVLHGNMKLVLHFRTGNKPRFKHVILLDD